MGEIYRAKDTSLDRDVAIKAAGPVRQRSGTPRAIEREAKTLAALNHPNIGPDPWPRNIREGSARLSWSLSMATTCRSGSSQGPGSLSPTHCRLRGRSRTLIRPRTPRASSIATEAGQYQAAARRHREILDFGLPRRSAVRGAARRRPCPSSPTLTMPAVDALRA